jgi:hypothetical protein
MEAYNIPYLKEIQNNPISREGASDCVLRCQRGSFVGFFGSEEGDEGRDPSMPNVTARHRYD